MSRLIVSFCLAKEPKCDLSLLSFYLRCIFKEFPEFHIEPQQNKETLGPLISVFKKHFYFQAREIQSMTNPIYLKSLGAKGLQGELEMRNAVCVHLRIFLSPSAPLAPLFPVKAAVSHPQN